MTGRLGRTQAPLKRQEPGDGYRRPASHRPYILPFQGTSHFSVFLISRSNV